MKIKKIIIENYKSIKRLEVIPRPGLNVYIGENSVGKSNIFDAINWLLGPVYPSFNSTTPQDHWGGLLENKIKISLEYSDGNILELAEEWTDSYGKQKTGLNLSGGYIKGEQRERYCSAYLGTEREVKDYLPLNRWSLLGRVLQQINAVFLSEDMSNIDGSTKQKSDALKAKLHEIRDNILFSVGRTAPAGKDGLMDKFVSILQEESAKQLNRRQDEFTIDLSLYDPWNFFRTLQLLVSESDTGMTFQASVLGMGVQASITIAILKAYAQLSLPNKTPIFLDEPELFLHPQAQRNFYNLLREMSENEIDPSSGEVKREGLQIFYTTHSPNFLRTDFFDEIHLIRKNKERGTYINTAEFQDFVDDLKIRKGINSSLEEMSLHFKNAYENTGDSQKANEAFFARKIILVEGQSESLILPYLFELLKFDFIKEGITIVRCGGKDEIDRFFRLYNEFGIPCFIIFDGDKQHLGTKDEASTKKKNSAIFELFGITAEWADGKVYDRFLGFENDLESNLGFSTTKKGLDLYIETKSKIISVKNLPTWVSTVVEKVKSMDDPSGSVLKKAAPANDDEIRIEDIPF
ncbi:AAA family ATPase [Patescibacteria group bacterium]|nr:AAA family ATPase [Patescibacteria group bacterium]